VFPQIVTGIRGWLVTLWSILTTELLLILEGCTYWVWWHWLDLLHAGLEDAITVKSRPVRKQSCLAVFATKDSSLNGTRRVSSVATVVTLVSGFHRHAVLGELSSLSVLPSYDCDSALIIVFIIIIIIVTIYASGLFQLQVLCLVELSLTSVFISCYFWE